MKKGSEAPFEHGGQGSNLRPTDLESVALPTELPPYEPWQVNNALERCQEISKESALSSLKR